MAQRERRSCKQDHALTPQVFPPSNLVLGPVLHRPGRSSVTLYQRTRFGCQRGSVERQKEWNLLLPDSEYLRPADRAGSLCSRSAVLECHWARVTNLSFGPALHAICVHISTSSVPRWAHIRPRAPGNARTAPTDNLSFHSRGFPLDGHRAFRVRLNRCRGS